MALTRIGTSAYSTLDATKLVGNLPSISGASLTGITTGKVLQLVNGTTTSSFTTSSGSFGTVGINLNITPSATSSKILLLFSATVDTSASGRQGDLTIWREISSSNIALNGNGFMQLYNSAGRNVGSGTFNYYDSPSTTNQILYRVAARSNTGTEINIGANTGGTITLTAIEVGA